MEYLSHERSNEECGDGGAEHEGNGFAELAPEFPVKDDDAIKGESCDKEDADRG